MSTTTMTPEVANLIYDALVTHAGANERGRHDFVYHQTHGEVCTEYRFQGSLRFGGKFWRNRSWNRCPWYVNAYREDETPTVLAAIDATNARLAKIYADAEVEL